MACAGSLTGRDGEFIVDAGQYRLVVVEYSDGQRHVMTFNPAPTSDEQAHP